MWAFIYMDRAGEEQVETRVALSPFLRTLLFSDRRAPFGALIGPLFFFCPKLRLQEMGPVSVKWASRLHDLKVLEVSVRT